VTTACAINQPDAPASPGISQALSYSTPKQYTEHQAMQRRFTTDAGEIAYTDHGTGTVLVLLHGVPTSSWMYRNIIPSLQGSYRVISIDLLGYGSSAKPQNDDKAYLPDNQATIVQALLTHLNIDKFALAVHDMSGLVAWSLMRTNAPISELIIMNTIVRDEGFEQPELDKGLLTELKTEAMSNALTSEMMLESTFKSLGLDLKKDLTDSEAEGYIAPVKLGSDEAIYAFYTSMDEAFFKQLESNAIIFNQFDGRSLILWGAKDKTLTTRQIPFLQQHLRIPPGQVNIFDNQGHFLVEEIPEAISQKIKAFLN